MKSGRIEQFAHLSEFKTVMEFNKSVAAALDIQFMATILRKENESRSFS